MSRCRAFLGITAAALVAVLATGCVEQPFDESLLETTEAPGVAAAPLNGKAAKRAAHKARRAQVRKAGGQQGRPQRDPASGGSGGAPSGGNTAPDATGGDGGADDGDTGGSGGSGGTDGRGTQPSQPRNDDGGGEQPRQPRQARFRPIGTVADAGGDASGESPAYADVRQLLIESNGATARVTVALDARIPTALADGEVEGIGVDFYRSDDRESDYQIFVDGGSDGWQAFLHTRTGVIDYPGRFAMGGRVFVFTLPWSALGGRKPADVSMFIDWSEERTLLNAVGNDRAPDDGRITIDPR